MCFVKVQEGRKCTELTWWKMMAKASHSGGITCVPLRCEGVQWGKGRPKSHDPWAGSNWAFDERLSGSKVVAAAEAGDCWRRSGKRQVLSRTKGTRYGEDLGPQCSPFPPSGKPFPFPPLTKLILFLQLLLKDHLLQEAFLDHTGWVREPSSGHLLPLGCPGHSTSSTTC